MEHIKTYPEKIYLQNENEETYDMHIIWCEEKINDTDVEYIRADKFQILKNFAALIDSHAAQVGASHPHLGFSYSDVPDMDEVRKIFKQSFPKQSGGK